MTSVTRVANATTFSELLALRAESAPDDLAFTFLVDGETDEDVVTYHELYRRSSAIAARLRGPAAPGDRALLLFPPGLDYVAALLACWHSGVIGVSTAPPQPKRLERTLGRLLGVAADADPVCVLTTPALWEAARPLLGEDQPLARAEWIAIDDARTLESDLADPVQVDRDDVAFLQYTSGSTAAPRGVMLTHGNLLDNSELIARAFEHSPETKTFMWLPPYHDMGLIGGILQPIYVGCRCVLTSPVAMIRRPARWLEGISRHRATTSGGPNFAYDLCVRKIEPDVRERLDLSSWDLAFNGAEPVRAETIEAFTAMFEPHGFSRLAFYPCYGLAEATLMTTGPAKTAAPSLRAFDADALEQGLARPATDSRRAATLVGCGQTADGHELRVVSPETQRTCPADAVGEIWIAGPSVAKGYWRREQLTEQTFGARLATEPRAGPYLRSGDLGVVRDDELFVVGRIKDLLIVNGRNVHPHDVEAVAEGAHPRLRPHSSAAFGMGSDAELALVLEVNEASPAELAEALEAIRKRVASELDLQLHAVTLCHAGEVPKTTSGKIQRRLCRSLLEKGEIAAAAEWRLRAQR